MRIAAIDIGTNSLHMIVVRVRPDLSFEVIDREKEMVRLGAGGLDGRALTPEAMHAALQVLSKFRAPGRVARRRRDRRGRDQRDARGRKRRRVPPGRSPQQTGIRARVISGTEEARLIHLAAAYGVGVPGDVAVVVDIGGGSVEITRGAGPTIELGRSFKLGVIRLTERFVKSDPLAPRDERKLVKHIDAELGDYLDQIVARRLRSRDRHVGHDPEPRRGGARQPTAGRPARRCATGASRPSSSAACASSSSSLDLEQRLRDPGPRSAARRPRRRPASILLDTILRRLGADEITLCDLSLREGLVLDYIARHRKQIAQADRYPDVRRRSVIELAERCNYWPEHAHQVARLARRAVRPDARRCTR